MQVCLVYEIVIARIIFKSFRGVHCVKITQKTISVENGHFHKAYARHSTAELFHERKAKII